MSRFRVHPIDFRTDPRLMPFLSAQPRASIYHHPAWLAALQAESGQRSLMLGCEAADGSLQGVLPLSRTRGLPLNFSNHQTKRRLASLPRTPSCGPLSISPEASRLLVSAAARQAKMHDSQLQIKTDCPLPEAEQLNLGYCQWRPTYVVELPKSLDQLTFGDAKTRHKLKWGVSKAVKLGLTLRHAQTEDDLKAWYAPYLVTMQRNFVPPRPLRFFRSLWRGLRGLGHLDLVLAERTAGSGKELVGGSIFLMMGQTVSYAFTGCFSSHLSAHANDIVLWEAIHEACRHGYRFFDLGEVAEEHPSLLRFKMKWGAVPTALYRYYDTPVVPKGRPMVPHWMRSTLAKGWQFMPLSMTARAGDWIIRYI